MTDRIADDQSPLDLVARVAVLLPQLTVSELDDLAEAVENLTDAIAFTIETAASTESEAGRGGAAREVGRNRGAGNSGASSTS